jgi:hypothetical protein
MKYTVVWSQAVENLLADIWLACDDRNEVTRAMADRERGLRQRRGNHLPVAEFARIQTN